MAVLQTKRAPLIVQKFGGSSLASVERLQRVARRIATTRASGARVVAVVSAMGDETDRLLSLSRTISDAPPARELDVLAASGEQVSASLLAMCLGQAGHPARSFLGHQVRILTDGRHGEAGIKRVDRERLLDTLAEGQTPVVAGFQGVDDDGNITTIGRGGTDTTAVAVAGAIGADCCEIYTDVDGVYTADPSQCSTARKHVHLSYRQMLALSSLGSKVLAARSVYVAMKHRVPIHVRSSFVADSGTWVLDQDDASGGGPIIGIARSSTIACLRTTPRSARIDPIETIEMLARHDIMAEPMAPIASRDASTIHPPLLVVDRADARRAQMLVAPLGNPDSTVDTSFESAKLAVVGTGLDSMPGLLDTMLARLTGDGISVHATGSTGPTELSVLVDHEQLTEAICALHDELDLGSPTERPRERLTG